MSAVSEEVMSDGVQGHQCESVRTTGRRAVLRGARAGEEGRPLRAPAARQGATMWYQVVIKWSSSGHHVVIMWSSC